jgi:hypothetical protein
MNLPELTEQVSELRWLAYELGNEMQTLETTAHPLAHQFLMHGLARRIAQVAAQTCHSLSQPTSSPLACPEEEPPIEHQSASHLRGRRLLL